MFGEVALVVFAVFLILIAVFLCQCCPAKCPVFDPACCPSSCAHSAYIPFYGNSLAAPVGELPPVPFLPAALTASDYLALTEGNAVVGAVSDLASDGGMAAGYAAPFTSPGRIQDLTAWILAH